MNLELFSLSSYVLAAGEGGSPLGFLPIVLMVVMMYFILIRPQRMRQKAIAEQVDAMKKGDKVISAGGIHGQIANMKETTVIVKVAENVKMEFLKSSIITVIPKGKEKADIDIEKPTADNEQLRG